MITNKLFKNIGSQAHSASYKKKIANTIKPVMKYCDLKIKKDSYICKGNLVGKFSTHNFIATLFEKILS